MAIHDICYLLLDQHNNNLTYFFPTDHIINNDPNFFSKILIDIDSNKINIFGQKATESCNKFGYIIAEEILSKQYYSVREFIEKPKQSLSTEKLYRNLGIYLTKPSTIYAEFKRLYPKTSYELNLSIDKMIAEQSQLLNLIEVDFNWSDIGSISNLYKSFGEYKFNNIEINQDDILQFNKNHSEFKLEYDNKTLRIIKKSLRNSINL